MYNSLNFQLLLWPFWRRQLARLDTRRHFDFLFQSSTHFFLRQFQPRFFPPFANFPCRNSTKHSKLTYRHWISPNFSLNQPLIWTESLEATENLTWFDLFTPRHRYLLTSRYIKTSSIFTHFLSLNPQISYLIRWLNAQTWVSTKAKAETRWGLDRNGPRVFTIFLAQILRFGYVLLGSRLGAVVSCCR